MFTTRIHSRFAVLASCLILLSACASTPRDFETPAGPRPGDQVGPFRILGVISRSTSTLNQSNARNGFEETITVNVPPGTELIIPAMRGWIVGYGSATPNDLSADPNARWTWSSQDHNLGIASINVFVKDINAVDPSTNSQTARVTIAALLTDDNSDDSWFGLVNYNLICLGR